MKIKWESVGKFYTFSTSAIPAHLLACMA